MATIGFLGTGVMGAPMARNLARAGNDVRAWNRTIEKAAPLKDDGVDVRNDPAEAARGAEVAAQRIAEETGALDPQAEDPAVQLAAAVATYLTYRRDEVDEDPRSLLELAARAEFDGHPPEGVDELLAELGVEL